MMDGIATINDIHSAYIHGSIPTAKGESDDIMALNFPDERNGADSKVYQPSAYVRGSVDTFKAETSDIVAKSANHGVFAHRRRDDVNTINTWAEPHNANGVTPNTIIDSNDEPPCNNQQRMTIRAYRNRDIPVYIDPTRTPNWSPALPTDFVTYVNSETQSQSCVGGDVGCNAAPAIPSPANAWTGPNDSGFPHARRRLVLLRRRDDVNTINTWAEPHNANGVTPNSIIDSNDEPAGNNQQRMSARGYRKRDSDDTSTTTVTVTYPATTYTVAPVATVPVYYSSPVYYYDTSVIQPLYVDASPTYVLQRKR
jgi:hypothetical protein